MRRADVEGAGAVSPDERERDRRDLVADLEGHAGAALERERPHGVNRCPTRVSPVTADRGQRRLLGSAQSTIQPLSLHEGPGRLSGGGIGGELRVDHPPRVHDEKRSDHEDQEPERDGFDASDLPAVASEPTAHPSNSSRRMLTLRWTSSSPMAPPSEAGTNRGGRTTRSRTTVSSMPSPSVSSLVQSNSAAWPMRPKLLRASASISSRLGAPAPAARCTASLAIAFTVDVA